MIPFLAEDRNNPEGYTYIQNNQQSTAEGGIWKWQPVFVFEKNNVGLWG